MNKHSDVPCQTPRADLNRSLGQFIIDHADHDFGHTHVQASCRTCCHSTNAPATGEYADASTRSSSPAPSEDAFEKWQLPLWDAINRFRSGNLIARESAVVEVNTIVREAIEAARSSGEPTAQALVDEAMAILKPRCADETLIGAIRNLQQAHISERDNAIAFEAEIERLRASLVVEKKWRKDAEERAENAVANYERLRSSSGGVDSDMFHLARLAVAGKTSDCVLIVRRMVGRIRKSDPDLADALAKLVPVSVQECLRTSPAVDEGE